LIGRVLAAWRFGRTHPFGVLLAVVALVYAITASGYVALSDGASMLAVTSSIVHGHLDVPCSLGSPGVANRCYSIYGPGWSLVALPSYVVGLLVERHVYLVHAYSVSVFAVSFVNPILTAVAAFVLAKFVYALSGSVRKLRSASHWSCCY
jgi:hypothetical protein